MNGSRCFFILCIISLLQSCVNSEKTNTYVPDQKVINILNTKIDSCLTTKNYDAYIVNQKELATIYKKSDSLAAWLHCYDRIIKISRDNISLEQAITYYKIVNDQIWRKPTDSASIDNLAWIHRQIAYEFGPKLQKWQLSIPYYIEGINLIESADSWTSDKAIKFLKPCGSAYTRVGEPQTAIGYLKKCYAICALASDTLNMVKTLNDLGLAYYDVAQFNEAFNTYSKALSLNKSGNYAEEYRGTISKMLTCFIDNKQIDSAKLYLQLLNSANQFTNTEQDEIADFYAQLGRYYVLINNIQLAELNYTKSIKMFLESPEHKGREAAKVCIELGNMLLQNGNYEKSITAYHQALTIMIPNLNSAVDIPVPQVYLFPDNVIMEAGCGIGDAKYAQYLKNKNTNDCTLAIQYYETAIGTRNLLLASYKLQSSKIQFEEKTNSITTKLIAAKSAISSH